MLEASAIRLERRVALADKNHHPQKKWWSLNQRVFFSTKLLPPKRNLKSPWCSFKNIPHLLSSKIHPFPSQRLGFPKWRLLKEVREPPWELLRFGSQSPLPSVWDTFPLNIFQRVKIRPGKFPVFKYGLQTSATSDCMNQRLGGKTCINPAAFHYKFLA